MKQEQEYIPGLGKDSVVPPELKGWNWGAFLLNWIWGIGNSTYIAFLMFVPLVNIVMFFVLGAKGNEWAWRNRTWRDIEHFKQTQRKWRNAGLILLFVVFPLFFTLIGSMLKGEAFDQSMATISKSTEVIEVVGEPIEAGYFVWEVFRLQALKERHLYNILFQGLKEKLMFMSKHLKKWKHGHYIT